MNGPARTAEPLLDPPGRVRSRVRFQVLGFGVALAAITYLDRVCIAMTAKDMMRDLSLSAVQMSLVFSAFTLAYAVFEIPTGAWGDRIGTRRVLTRIVAWWSCFTMATAAASSYASLLVIRFLFGAGEAGAWPNVARTFSRWFPATERGTAQGIFFMGAHLGGGLTPILVNALLSKVHWRTIFVLFGAVGFVWAAAWYWWFRDDPAEHAAVSPKELAHIREGRTPEASHRLDAATWALLLGNRSLWALCLMYMTQTYGFYYFITWYPTYLEQRGFTALDQGIWAGMPLFLSVLADLCGGLTTDRLVRRFGARVGRCGVGGLSLLMAGVCMLTGAAAADPLVAAVLIALAGASANFLLGAAWGVCIDVSGGHTGVVSACMNTAGQVGGVLSPIAAALLVRHTANWSAPLYVTGALYLAGALCWALVDPLRPILGKAPDPHDPLGDGV